VRYPELVSVTAQIFEKHAVPTARAQAAARALCYGDLVGIDSHGLINLSRLYLPLFAQGRVDAGADIEPVADRGAAMLVDAHRALGLWAAGEAMRLAIERAAELGVAMVSMRGGTHFGCAGFHAAQAVPHQMIGIVASNCGGQRIARPPGGTVTMLGTNPIAIAAPAGRQHPFVLDMSTTVVPTGRIRSAARSGRAIPPGWLDDDRGRPVTDPNAFDRGDAHLLWLGGRPETGAFKGFGLGLLVEVLAALVCGAATGLHPEALSGDGGPTGTDDDIGMIAIAIAPGELRGADAFISDIERAFGTLLACPSAGPAPVRYPGWHEAESARRHARIGVPLARSLYRELADIAAELGLAAPAVIGAGR
jgi:LDH2 family malate/lactate/ureidoglycolate dehydrogenase